jgi:hypothetical protein
MDAPDPAPDDTTVDVGPTVRFERLEVLLDLDRALCDAANRYSLAAQIVHRRGLNSPGFL